MTSQPDIIFVMSDEHAPQFSSVYGHPIVQTPNMERLAESGMRFDAAYCASPICVPSRMAFLTAQLPSKTEAWDNGSPLRSDIPTLAHVLRQCGYETMLIGKMHFIGPDRLHGFEHRLVDDSRVCGNWIESVDWDHPDTPRESARKRLTNAGAGRTAHIDQDEAVLATALAEIDRLRTDQSHRRPVFLCISFNAPHFPLRAPKYFDKYWPDNVDAPVVLERELEGQHPFHHRLRSYFDINEISEDQNLRARAAFYALTSWLDELLGKIINKVDEAPLSRAGEPIVCYASDHGDMAGEHGLWWKCCFFEESARVPLIVRWPGYVKPASSGETPVSLLDLSVTFAEIAGARDHELTRSFLTNSNGASLQAILSGQSDPERFVISEYLAHAAGRPIRMMRKGNWKYVYYHGEPDELYDLKNDPGEKHNLAQIARHAGRIAEMRSVLLKDWDPDALEGRIRKHHEARNLIASVENMGTFE